MPPTIVTNPIWTHTSYPDVILIPTPATRSSRRGLTMDSRFALQARRYSPLNLREIATQLLENHPTPNKFGFLLLTPRAPGFALFQTTLNAKESASHELIRYSAEQLAEYATEHNNTTFALPFPGVGKNDNISPEKTYQILQVLPENVRLHVPKYLLPRLGLQDHNN